MKDNSQQYKLQEYANKWLKGEITDAEMMEFNQWFLQGLEMPYEIPENIAISEKEHKEKLWRLIIANQQTFSSNIAEHPSRNKIKFPLWSRIASIAAVVLLTLCTGIWLIKENGKNKLDITTADLPPGKNGATLTLANGKKIIISNGKADTLAKNTEVTITKTADGQIIYNATNTPNPGINSINTLETSKGEQTKINLPDGTVVFLNAASSLKFPTSFKNFNARTVELSGEGYFYVHKDANHPFIVKTRYQEVKVLGTEFNVSSYSDDSAVRTTLMEGSVLVSGNNNLSRILKPNQQAVNTGREMKIFDVEAQLLVDWKQGFFMFNQESLEQLMKRISRWYNVEVQFDNPSMKKELISGTISKYEKLSSLIKVLQRSGIATLELQGNVLIIKDK
ncbi:MAG: FecR domain-containing protein [Pedobacter sp.]